MINEVDLPIGWVVGELGDVCDILDAQRIPVNAEERKKRIAKKSEAELYPYYGATGEVGKIDDYIFDGQFLLLGEDAAPFFDSSKDTAYLAKGKFWVNNHAHIIKSSILHDSFLCFFLNQFNFEGYVSGTTRLKLPQGSMKQIPIKFPSVNEQNRIVDKVEALFSEVDAGIANLTLAKRQLEQYRQSLLKHAFEGKLTAKWREEYAEKHGKSLPSVDELLEQIQTARQDYYDQQIVDWEQAVKSWEEQGKEGRKPSKPTKPKELLVLDSSNLPHEWVVVEFEGICELIRNGLSLKPEGHEGTKILRISAVRAFSLNLDDYRYLSSEHEVASFLLQQGDLLFTRYNGTRRYVGVCALFKSTEDYVYPDKLIRARVDLDEVENSFLAYGLNVGVSRSFIERRIRTTAGQSGISGGDIKKMPVVLCSKQEQDIIVSTLDEKLSETDSIISTLESKILKANLLKTSILHKAFQGKLVPQDANDPPASELLAQIQAEREAKALAEKQAKQDKAASKSNAKIKSAKESKKSKKDEQITLPL
tara:strand:+ start:369 stop:1973 length:1605 start_codon:yes stop_codon:yes gene_type:complete